MDYEPTTGTLTFATGETLKTILVPILEDTLVEGNETFWSSSPIQRGGGVLVSPSQTVITIVDNDQAASWNSKRRAISSPSRSRQQQCRDPSRPARDQPRTASVQFETRDGSGLAGVHYVASAGTVAFNAGETSRTFTVPVLPNALDINSTVTLLLSNPGGGHLGSSRATAELTILNRAMSLQFSAATYSVVEGLPPRSWSSVSGRADVEAAVRY